MDFGFESVFHGYTCYHSAINVIDALLYNFITGNLISYYVTFCNSNFDRSREQTSRRNNLNRNQITELADINRT